MTQGFPAGIPHKNFGIPKIGDKKAPIKPDSI
jgi:hypothetical protein